MVSISRFHAVAAVAAVIFLLGCVRAVTLLLTPAASRHELRALLDAVRDAVDVVQVRPKPLGESAAPAPARDCLELTRLALEVLGTGDDAPLVIVDDRVDVARALWDEGAAGVHLGQDDAPPRVARDALGPGPVIGLSTHDLTQVVLAGEEPVDYVGFGPIHATGTKGYGAGLGPELAWVASGAAPGPLFPIGGIDGTNVDGLAEVGRAVVGAAILDAEDPREAARALGRALAEPA